MSLKITGFGHVGVRVHDLERSRRFYERLGFEFVVGPIGPEPVAIMTHPSGVEINFVLNAPDADVPNPLMDVPEKLPGYTHIALLIDDLDGAMEALAEQGITPSGGPVTFPHGARAVFVRDPDRNVIELHQPAG